MTEEELKKIEVLLKMSRATAVLKRAIVKTGHFEMAPSVRDIEREVEKMILDIFFIPPIDLEDTQP